MFHPVGDFYHVGFGEAAGGDGGGAEADAGGAEGWEWVVRDGVGVEIEADFVEGGFVGFAAYIVGFHDV